MVAKKKKKVAKKSSKKIMKNTKKSASIKKAASASKKKVGKKTVKKATQKTAKESAKKVTKKISKKVAKKIVKEPVKKATKKIMKEPSKDKKTSKKFKKREKLIVKHEQVNSKNQNETIETKVEESKYVTTNEKFHTPPPSFRIWDPFQTPIDPPAVYLKDRAILLTIDPTFVYLYWEIRPETMAFGRERVGHDSEYVLRVYDVTAISHFHGDNAHSYWDIPIHNLVGGWYIRLDNSDKNLVVDVGLRSTNGDFFTLVRSNYSGVPRKRMAHHNKIYWMTVGPNGEIVLTEEEDYTDADLELLRRIFGDLYYKKFKEGSLGEFLGASEITGRFVDVEVSFLGSS